MQICIRAEDFAFGDDFLDLGGRVVAGSSILSAAVQKRTSFELIVLVLAIGGGLWALTFEMPAAAKVAILVFICFLAAGAVRELRHNYVATMNIYQIGQFEVRGLTRKQAVEIQEVLKIVRGHTGAPPFGGAAGDAS